MLTTLARRSRAALPFLAAAVAIAGGLLAMTRLEAQTDTGIPKADKSEWIQLFNGKNLDGWTP